MVLKCCLIILLAVFVIGCGHTQSHKIGLMSVGDLEGKVIPENIDGDILEGEDCAEPGHATYFLSEAVRDALKQKEYDTLIDVEVTNTTGVFVPENCIKVTGKAINSKKLSMSGGN